ncbi:MAG: hypothetical protein AAF705_15005 [Bacteroidota bacterium]
MKYALLWMMLIVVGPLLGQNYYVAIVKGEVYYNNKRVKKRDKINLKGTVRFTAKTDYLKLSGPGGLYTLRAESSAAQKQGNEFLLSVQAEIYPRVVERPTTAHGFSEIMNGIDTAFFYLDGGFKGSFYWSKINFRMRSDYPRSSVWAIIEDDAGLSYQEMSVVDTTITLDLSAWDPGKREIAGRRIAEVTFLQVNDDAAWRKIQTKLQSARDLWAHYPHFDESVSLMGDPITITLNEDGTQDIVEEPEEPEPTGLILDDFSPVVYNRKAVTKDLKRLVKQSGAIYIQEFMHEMYYDEYVNEMYGWNNNGQVHAILRTLLLE